MDNLRILFQGSYKHIDKRVDLDDQLSLAKSIANELGTTLIRDGFNVIVTGCEDLDKSIGEAAEKTCLELNVDPKKRITTYVYGSPVSSGEGFGKVLRLKRSYWQEARTDIVNESDAVIGLLGGKGTFDCIEKAILAKKPVFPIGVVGGGAREVWDKLNDRKYYNMSPGDIEFLADMKVTPVELAKHISAECKAILSRSSKHHSRKIFIVHGHDTGLMEEIRNFLKELAFEPVVIQTLPEKGRQLFLKLKEELADVGYGMVLLTEDDVGAVRSDKENLNNRARQNVIFEYGMLAGMLGTERVCAIVKGDIERPSDLDGFLFINIPDGRNLKTIFMDLINELKGAGYAVNPNSLFPDPV